MVVLRRSGLWAVVMVVVVVVGALAPGAHGKCPKDSSVEAINSIAELLELCKIKSQYPFSGGIPASIAKLKGLRHLSLRGGSYLSVAELPVELGGLSELTHLDLSDGRLTSIPDGLFARLTNLETLSLRKHRLTSLPADLNALTNLAFLDLGGNDLTSFPTGLQNLSALHTLRLYNNEIKTVPEWIASLTSLRELNLFGNLYTKLPSSIGSLSRLSVLDVVSQHLKALPASIGDLNKTLDLRFDLFVTKLPKTIAKFEKPTTLDLGWIDQKGAPPSWCHLKQLQSISVEDIKSLPPCLGSLPRLDSFSVEVDRGEPFPKGLTSLKNIKRLLLKWSYTVRESLPRNFGDLSSLETLVISGPVKHLPDSFARLTNLRSAYLNFEDDSYSHNTPWLRSLPKKIGNLQKLTHLQLRGSRLTRLPESFSRLRLSQFSLTWQWRLEQLPKSFGRMRRLTSLELDGENLQKLPKSFGQLSLLQSLGLSYNKLRDLPDGFDRLSSLRTLSLGSNKFKAFPEGISGLSSLEVLWMSENSLWKMPSSFGQLSLLRTVDLSNNQLQRMPELSELSQLTFLALDRNQLTALPQGLANNLTSLHVSHNQIERMPQLSHLSQLKSLWARNNQLTAVPDLSKLTSLRSIDLRGNMLTSVPTGLRTVGNLQLHDNIIYSFPPDMYIPRQRPAPDQRNWEMCRMVNTKKSKAEWKCRRNTSCHWCDNGLGCQPALQWHNQGAFPSSQACNNQSMVSGAQMTVTGTSDEVDAVVKLFPWCPSPAEMTGCQARNLFLQQESKSSRKRKCEKAFEFQFEGSTHKVGKKRCFFWDGLCRAAGDYFESRKAIAMLPVLFDSDRGCPFLSGGDT